MWLKIFKLSYFIWHSCVLVCMYWILARLKSDKVDPIEKMAQIWMNASASRSNLSKFKKIPVIRYFQFSLYTFTSRRNFVCQNIKVCTNQQIACSELNLYIPLTGSDCALNCIRKMSMDKMYRRKCLYTSSASQPYESFYQTEWSESTMNKLKLNKLYIHQWHYYSRKLHAK